MQCMFYRIQKDNWKCSYMHMWQFWWWDEQVSVCLWKAGWSEYCGNNTAAIAGGAADTKALENGFSGWEAVFCALRGQKEPSFGFWLAFTLNRAIN